MKHLRWFWPKRQRAFTLIEMVIVVAIIATAQVQACSTSIVIGPEAMRIIRSAPCFL